LAAALLVLWAIRIDKASALIEDERVLPLLVTSSTYGTRMQLSSFSEGSTFLAVVIEVGTSRILGAVVNDQAATVFLRSLVF
jgi:hypothetical protein